MQTFTIAFLAVNIYQVHATATGKHAYDTTWSQLELGFKMGFAQLFLYIWATCFTRLCILFLYLRVIPTTYKILRWVSRAVFGYVAFLCVLSTLISAFANNPGRASWDLNATLKPHESLNDGVLFTVLSALYAVGDTVIWALPIPFLWNRQTSWTKRCSLISLFIFGFVACLAVYIRSAYIARVYTRYDFSWNAFPVLLCEQIECTVGALCALIPTLSSDITAMVYKGQSSHRGSGSIEKSEAETAHDGSSRDKLRGELEAGEAESSHPDTSSGRESIHETSLKKDEAEDFAKRWDDWYSRHIGASDKKADSSAVSLDQVQRPVADSV